MDDIEIPDIQKAIESGKATLYNKTKNVEISLKSEFSERQIDVLKAGGYLNYVRTKLISRRINVKERRYEG